MQLRMANLILLFEVEELKTSAILLRYGCQDTYSLWCLRLNQKGIYQNFFVSIHLVDRPENFHVVRKDPVGEQVY